jgi:hypothetical protein
MKYIGFKHQFLNINSDTGYMDLLFFFKVDRGWIQTFLKEGENRGTGGGRNETLFNDIVSPMVYV